MAEFDFTRQIPASAAVTELAGIAPAEAWGIFRETSGLDCRTATELFDLADEQAEAQEVARGLNAREGVFVREVTNDHESNISRSVHFDVGQVTLKSSHVEVRRVDIYERVTQS